MSWWRSLNQQDVLAKTLANGGNGLIIMKDPEKVESITSITKYSFKKFCSPAFYDNPFNHLFSLSVSGPDSLSDVIYDRILQSPHVTMFFLSINIQVDERFYPFFIKELLPQVRNGQDEVLLAEPCLRFNWMSYCKTNKLIFNSEVRTLNDGILLASMAMVFGVVNIKTRKFGTISPDIQGMIGQMYPNTNLDEVQIREKPENILGAATTTEVIEKYIDHNKHTNMKVYLENSLNATCNTLNQDKKRPSYFWMTNPVRSFKVSFRKESMLGDQLSCTAWTETEGRKCLHVTHIVRDRDNQLCSNSELEFQHELPSKMQKPVGFQSLEEVEGRLETSAGGGTTDDLNEGGANILTYSYFENIMSASYCASQQFQGSSVNFLLGAAESAQNFFMHDDRWPFHELLTTYMFFYLTVHVETSPIVEKYISHYKKAKKNMPIACISWLSKVERKTFTLVQEMYAVEDSSYLGRVIDVIGLADVTTRSLVKVPNHLGKWVSRTRPRYTQARFPVQAPKEEMKTVLFHMVIPSECIDYYNHANFKTYFEITCRTFEKFAAENLSFGAQKIKSVSVQYIKECMLNERLLGVMWEDKDIGCLFCQIMKLGDDSEQKTLVAFAKVETMTSRNDETRLMSRI